MKRRLQLLVATALVLIGTSASALAQKKPPPAPLDLNAATLEQLTQLPGVGPVTAKAILDFRTKSGPFRRIEDLLAIRGITDRRLKELRPYITVQPAKKSALYAPHGVIPNFQVSVAVLDSTRTFSGGKSCASSSAS